MEKNSTKPILYNNNDLASDTIDTIILSGGGYLGILYFGLIKLLDAKNLYPGIKRVYGVSVGSIFALLIILKYSYTDAISLLETDFDVTKFITFNSKDIFNLPETYGLTEPVYIEQCVKSVLEKTGLSPYITMDDLYNHTGIEFNLGVTLAMQNKYVLINHITRPDLPVWLAIRMSANLPIIFNPVRDTVFNDFVYDGGHLNNNPIKYYLESVYKPVLCEVSTQTDEPETNSNDCSNIINKTCDPDPEKSDGGENAKQTYDSNQIILPTFNFKSISSLCERRDCKNDVEAVALHRTGDSMPVQTVYKMPLKKYKMNFICIDLKIIRLQAVQSVTDLDKITLIDYLVSIISKFTYNQDAYKPKYMQYMLSIDCAQFPELLEIPFTASNAKIKEICEKGYEIIYMYYNNLLN